MDSYEILWWSNAQDIMLPLQGAWVLSLVKELRSFKPHSEVKKKKKKNKNKNNGLF